MTSQIVRDPDVIPDQLEIDAVTLKIEAMRGKPISAAAKSAIAGMTRKEISDYIKEKIR